MLSVTCKIDKDGKIKLPKKALKESGLFPETEAFLELKDNGLLIKPKNNSTPVTQRISEMDLPVSDWEDKEWLKASCDNPAFDFLKDKEEDIYSINDEKKFNG